MANIDLLQQRKTNILTQLSQLQSGQGYDLPNAQGGGSVDFTGKIASLYDELAKINQLIAAEVGPWEVQVKGAT